jgi:hypothetical protein
MSLWSWAKGAVNDAYDWTKEAAGDAYDTVAGGVEDFFTADTADTPDVKPGMYKVDPKGRKEILTGISNYGTAAQNASNNIETTAGDLAGEVDASGRQNASAINSRANEVGNLASGAIQSQSGVAGQAGEAARRAASGSQQGFTTDQAGELGAKNNSINLRDKNARTDSVMNDVSGADVSAPLRGAVDAAGNMVEKAGNNAGTQKLTSWNPAITGASGESQAAQEYLAGYGTAQNNGLDRYRDFATGVKPGSDTSSAAGSLGSLGSQLLQPSTNSEAEAQLKMGLDANVAAQFALANSGRGAYNGDALRQAQSTAATLGQQTSAQAAQLRAKETADRLALAQQAFSAQGQIGQGMDQTNLAAEQNRMQQLSDVSAAERDTAAKASAAAATNDEMGLNAQGQALSALVSGSQATNTDTRASIDAVNALTNASSTMTNADLSKLGLLGNLANQGDQFDLTKNKQLDDAYRGMQADDLSAYLGDVSGRTQWAGVENQALSTQSGATATGYGQAIEAGNDALQGTIAAGNLETGATTNAANLLNGATITAEGMVVDAQGNILGTVADYWNQEAGREAGLYGTWINSETQADITNTNADVAKDSSITGMIGAAAGVAGFL